MRGFEWLINRIADRKQLRAVRKAKKRADELHDLTGKRMHVVQVGDEYKIYDRKGMLQIESLCKRNGRNIDWHSLVVYSTK